MVMWSILLGAIMTLAMIIKITRKDDDGDNS